MIISILIGTTPSYLKRLNNLCIAPYVYKKGLLDGDYGFSTAVGLFNTVINIVLLISMNAIVKKMNEGKGIY